MIAILLSTLLMATDTAAPSSPPPVSAPPTGAAAPAKANGAEMVCWDERPTGSHVSQKICESRDHMDKAKRAADDTLSARALDRPGLKSLPGH